MHGNFQVLTVRLFDNRRQLSERQIFIRCDLDYIDVLKLIPPDCLPCAVCPVDQQELLFEDGIGKGGIETLNVEPRVMSLRPQARILGPGTRPALIASRSWVSPSIPEWPRMRTVVIPLSRSSRADCAAIKARLVGDSTMANSRSGAN